MAYQVPWPKSYDLLACRKESCLHLLIIKNLFFLRSISYDYRPFRHCTDMDILKNYVDSHGQSEVAFAFCNLLGFQFMHRLKAIHAQKLYRPDPGIIDAFPNLQLVLTRNIDWNLIRQQYDQMIKYATALRLGTTETRVILKRFVRNNIKHPTYLILLELGKVVKTVFLCIITSPAAKLPGVY